MNKIINWLFEKIVDKIDNAGLYADRENTNSKLIDLEKRLGNKTNYEQWRDREDLMVAILEHLEVKPKRIRVEDPSYDKPSPRMMDKVILVPKNKS